MAVPVNTAPHPSSQPCGRSSLTPHFERGQRASTRISPLKTFFLKESVVPKQCTEACILDSAFFFCRGLSSQQTPCPSLIAPPPPRATFRKAKPGPPQRFHIQHLTPRFPQVTPLPPPRCKHHGLPSRASPPHRPTPPKQAPSPKPQWEAQVTNHGKYELCLSRALAPSPGPNMSPSTGSSMSSSPGYPDPEDEFLAAVPLCQGAATTMAEPVRGGGDGE